MQGAKCGFTDASDVIRSKILQTMVDGRLRREAMVKGYSLDELLKHAANKEDIDGQAKPIEQSLRLHRQEANEVNRIYENKSCYIVSVDSGAGRIEKLGGAKCRGLRGYAPPGKF